MTGEPEPMYLIGESQINTINHLLTIPEDSMDEADYMMRDDVLAAIRSNPVHSGAQQQAPAPKHGDCPDCPILTGDDAKRFHDYINDNNRQESPETKEMIRRANELAKTLCWDPKKRAEHDAQAATAERERWGRALDKWFKDHDCWKSENGNYWTPVPFPASDLMQLIESLRLQPSHVCGDDPRCHGECSGEVDGKFDCPCSQPEKHPEYCKHLKWLNQVEGGGEYRCELGNETSDEWCYKKERCGDYELVPECGACTGPDPLDELDRRCAIAAREYTPDPEKGEWASDSHRDPFNEVREWIAELRQQGRS